MTGNKSFASSADAKLLAKNAAGQTPETLWIGCADSRVPETTVCNCQPGDIFVHRNIANSIQSDDLNSAAVIEYAVNFLKVKRVVVCGHTKCGGAAASLGDADLGETLNNWLKPMRALRKKHQADLDAMSSDDAKTTRMAELNAMMSLDAIKANSTVANAMKERGLEVYGVIYDIPKGEIVELKEVEGKKGLFTMNGQA